MDTARRTLTLRRVAMTATLVALLAPAGQAEAAKRKVRQPVVTSVTPLNAEIGDTLTIRGRNFVPGAKRNTVVFRRDGARAVFVKANLATKKLMTVVLPATLEATMANQGAVKVATRFRVRILARRFGKSFTALSRSPMIGPDKPPPPPPAPSAAAADGDCDGDGVLNGKETDDDNDGLADDVELSLENLDPCKPDTDGDGVPDKFEYDCDRNGTLNRDQADDDSDLLDDGLEARILTDPCSKDTDGDQVEDGYEYKSATDLNDDEYQQPNTSLPYPGQRPYANPLDGKDAGVDYDGDGLSVREEFLLWEHTYTVTKVAKRTLEPLSYSDGLQYSVSTRCTSSMNPIPAACDNGSDAPGTHNGRRVPTLKALDYVKWFGTGTSSVCDGTQCNEEGFLKWAERNGYRTVWISQESVDHAANRFQFSILDVNRDGEEASTISGEYEARESHPFDLDSDGYVSDDERDEDADGLTNYDETHGRMIPGYWESCYTREKAYPVKYAGTNHVDNDSDDDGVRDGADDQDHDDVPNIMELSRVAASGHDDTEDGVETPEGALEPIVGPDGPGMSTCNPDKDLEADDPHHAGDYGMVNPFNPCLPSTRARTCTRHPGFSDLPAPFNAATPLWWSLN